VLELYGTSWCPYTAQMREDLQWRGKEFVEYDVDDDTAALSRLVAITGGNRIVPVLAEGERVLEAGYQGRSCYASPGS
jgi:glutaredoxin